jgi:predicted N-acetyltransferase YhbS
LVSTRIFGSWSVGWLGLAECDRQLNAPFSAGFVAVEEQRIVGTVPLLEFDIDAMRDRSPWICGMVVRPAYRGMQIGWRLLGSLGDVRQ